MLSGNARLQLFTFKVIALTLLLLVTMTTVTTTTLETTRSTPQQDGYHASVIRENSPPAGTYWAKTYGGINYDSAESVQETSDGGYIVAGYTNSSFVGGYLEGNVWVLKLDSTGSVMWQKTYGGSGDDVANSVQETSDGGYIVAGYTNSSGAGGDDFWVLKLNSTGSVMWQKTYGGITDDYAWSVQQTSDGGYITAGYTFSFGAGLSDAWVVKLDAGGNAAWIGGSGAWTHVTSVFPADSNAKVSDTSVAPGDSTAIVADTLVAPQDTHAIVKTQSPDITPPATITDLATNSPTSTSITLTWTARGDDGMSGNAAGYVVKYSISGPITDSNWASTANYTQSWMPTRNGTAETHTVTGLSPATTYWFAVEAYDGAPNYSGVSNSPSTTTLMVELGEASQLIIIVDGAAVAAAALVLVAEMHTERKKKPQLELRENVGIEFSCTKDGGYGSTATLVSFFSF